MKEEITQIKEGIKLHTINTDIFKTNLLSIFITKKLDRESVTKDALIPAVLRQGTQKYTSQEEINKMLEDMYGASFDCGVEKTGDNHILKFYLESINDNYLPKQENLMKKSIETILEIVFNPYLENEKFKTEYVESEKNNIKQLIEAKIDNKDLYSLTRCTEEMFKGKPYSLYKYGYIEDLENIKSEDLYKHYKEILQTCKIDIFISGNFEKEEIIKIVKENENINRLKDRNAEYCVNNEKTEEKEIKEENKIEEKMDIAQGKLVIGMDILTNMEDTRFQVLLYNTILGDSANSKLFQNVRERDNLAYTVRSAYIKPKHCIFIRAGIEVDNYEKAIKTIKEQLEEMKQGKFTEEEIQNAKKYIISSINSIPEEQDTEITYYFGQELANQYYTPEEYREKIEEVKKEDIEKIANQVTINTIYFLRN